MFIKPLHSFVFLVFVGGIVGWASFPTRPRGPRLKVESVVEMGILEHDEYRTQKVRLTNDGDDVLVLEKPLTGCACTSGELSKSRLRPGDVAEVTITYHAAQAAGTEVHQAVMLHSNCQEIPKRQVTLHGRMRGAVFAAPQCSATGAFDPEKLGSDPSVFVIRIGMSGSMSFMHRPT